MKQLRNDFGLLLLGALLAFFGGWLAFLLFLLGFFGLSVGLYVMGKKENTHVALQ